MEPVGAPDDHRHGLYGVGDRDVADLVFAVGQGRRRRRRRRRRRLLLLRLRRRGRRGTQGRNAEALKGLADVEAHHGGVWGRDAREVRPEVVVEVGGPQGLGGLGATVQGDGLCSAPNHLVGQEGQVFDVVHVAVADEHVVDDDLLVECEAATDSPSVDGDSVIDQKAGGAMTWGLAAVTSKDPHPHGPTVAGETPIGQVLGSDAC